MFLSFPNMQTMQFPPKMGRGVIARSPFHTPYLRHNAVSFMYIVQFRSLSGQRSRPAVGRGEATLCRH